MQMTAFDVLEFTLIERIVYEKRSIFIFICFILYFKIKEMHVFKKKERKKNRIKEKN